MPISISAVVRVPVTPELRSLPIHQKADLSQLKRGSEVYLLGNPGGRAWRMSLRPEAIAQIRGDLLEFESNLITGGHSGGALLTAGKEIAGMLRSDNPPYGEAVSIDRILERLKGWGYPANLSLALPKLTMGVEINCHLQPSGQPRCWDVGDKAQELEAVASVQLAEISAGHYHVCGIETGGKAFCWGRNTSGQLGNGTTRERHGVPVAVSRTHRFSSITAGATHTCALDQEHRAWCWGRGVEGRLGNDTGTGSSVPLEVAGGLRFQSLSAGSQHTCGVAENGDLYCWGGILGSGMSRAGVDAPDAFVPLLVKTSLKFRTVSAGRDLSCAVSVEADAYCWGSTEAANVRGLPRPTSLHIAAVPGRHKFTAISAGVDHACGVTTDSHVYCWGANDSGQLGSGSIEGHPDSRGSSGGRCLR
jgi:alpha-tubulin suppressor-like RCC1 family protein